jgi:hypothetical protein
MIKKKIKKMLKNKYYQLFLIAPPKYSCWEQRTQGALHYPVELFRNLETNEFLWVDPDDNILPENKERIEVCLKKERKEMSNCLFDFLSGWNYYCRIEPFVKKMMLPMAEHVDVNRQSDCWRKYDSTPIMLAANLDAEEAVAKLIDRDKFFSIRDLREVV